MLLPHKNNYKKKNNLKLSSSIISQPFNTHRPSYIQLHGAHLNMKKIHSKHTAPHFDFSTHLRSARKSLAAKQTRALTPLYSAAAPHNTHTFIASSSAAFSFERASLIRARAQFRSNSNARTRAED